MLLCAREMKVEILYWIAGTLWCVGALSEIAKFDRKIYVNNMDEPFAGAFMAVKVLLFFTWPYWYFYGKGE